MRAGNHIPVTRRAVLLATGATTAAGLAGCSAQQRMVRVTAPPPLAPVLAGTLALLRRYQDTATAVPALAGRLGPLLAETRTHADALAAAMGQPPPSLAAGAPQSPPTATAGGPTPPPTATAGGPTPPPTATAGGPQALPPDGSATGTQPRAEVAGGDPTMPPGGAAAGDSPSPGGTASGDPAAALAALRDAEARAQTQAADACLAAPAQHAGLLGSIAASRACHQDVLA